MLLFHPRMKNLFALFLSIWFAVAAYATHNRAGEITYRRLSDLTYEVTITTYTKIASPADRPSLLIEWGDGSSDTILRTNEPGDPVGLDIKKNVYIGQHTYSSIGSYCMFFEDPNRNSAVVNIPNSVNVPFSVNTCLYMNPFLGGNNSPILLNPPIDDACINKVYVHNPGAYDPDGDSLSYELTVCLGLLGEPIPGYSIPGGIDVNPYTGDFTWNVPTAIGEYNFAMYIHEWRNGVKIGTVTRDMQITVINCDNNPPEINTITDTCVEAGTLLEFMVYGTDVDNDYLTMTSTSGLYSFTGNPDEPDFPAQFPQPVNGVANVSAEFSWQTACSDVQLQPHTVLFRLEDDGNGYPVHLVDYHTVNITVVGPSPKNPTAIPLGNSINVGWDASVCTEATCYKIYRRNGYYGFIPDHCETGVPGYTGYTFIGSVSGLNTTTFIDDNNGLGLVHGVEYCYMIVACYPDGAESYASLEVCTDLVKDIPVITNVSIITTNLTTGSDSVVWSKPTELDTLQIPPPYEYRVYRSNDFTGSSFTLAATFNDLNDTIYVDNNVNTEGNPLSYKIELYSVPLDLIVGSTQASSVFLSIAETDNELVLSWAEEVPWTNYTYEIYKDDGSGNFIFLDSTDLQTYTDTGLVNGTSYCYKIRSVGSYFSEGLTTPLYNFSQEKCGIPLDSTPPCPPALAVTPDCDNYQNQLVWGYLDQDACSDDIVEYRIYYTPFLDSAFTFLVSIPDPTQIEFMHDSLLSIAGCYAITAVDSVGNESAILDSVCVDNCPEYELPNIFTPGEDNFNDSFVPFPYRYIQSINLTIYSRWGNIVFETTDPVINWDGTNQDSKLMCSDGVYFYVCEVNEIRLAGIETRKLKGFVHLIQGPGSSQ